MRHLIINADDFGNYFSVDKGIIHGIERGVITSTSLMVNRDHTDDVDKIKELPNISIGLHFELPKDGTKIIGEFNRQLEVFTRLVGRRPDHIDSHKIRPRNIEGLTDYLADYSRNTRTPIRDWGHANLIYQFFGLNLDGTGTLDVSRITSSALIRTLEDNLKEGYNELMTHAGYVDQEVTRATSYNKPRETELESLLSAEFTQYLMTNPDVKLVSWKEVLI